MRVKTLIPVLTFCACSLLAGIGHVRAADVNLPNIGSSAGEILSPEEARQYGASMLHEMRSLDMVLDDPLLVAYINALGYRLVAHSDKPDQAFTFFLVRDDIINAFAAPGGFVAVYTGLLVTTTTESELAAVMAHEIGHITQNHLVRAFEDAQKATLPIALAMLGALIATRGGSGDAGTAAIVSGMAAIQQRQINFTRKDEVEADRTGIQTLARANFDPNAMAGFFQRMQQALRPSDDGEVPEFLRTHPVSTSRISDAKSRAESLSKEVAARSPLLESTAGHAAPSSSWLLLQPGQAGKNPLTYGAATQVDLPHDREVSQRYYELMRERVRVLTAINPNAILGYYSDNLRDNPSFDTTANRYGYALALLYAHQPEKALAQMQKLGAAHPDQLVFQIGIAQSEFSFGRRDAALKRYAELETNYPRNRALALMHSDALLQQADTESAHKTQELLRPLLLDESDDPTMQTNFARACELAGDKIRAGQAYAEAALYSGHVEDALNQLKALTSRADLDYYQRARIEARITELTPYVLELRRKHIKPDAQDTKRQGLRAGLGRDSDATERDSSNTNSRKSSTTFCIGPNACTPLSSERNN